MSDAPPSELFDGEPVTLAAVKLNLRIDTDAEDDLVTDLVVDAREFVERSTGLVLKARTVTETTDGLGRWIDLSSWPVQAISAIRYPVAGVMTVLAAGSWQVSLARRPVRLLPALAGWGVGACGYANAAPALPVEIDVVAGYDDMADIPRAATRAMHLLIAHWYANRSTAEVGARAAAIEVPFGVTVLCNQLRLARV